MYNASQMEVGEYHDRVSLEVVTKFFSDYLESQCCLSETVNRVSSSEKDFLTKNIGLCFRCSSSLNKAALTETLETTM